MNLIKTEVPSKLDLEKLQQFVEENHKGQGQGYENALRTIDKQRRGWEESREKAEEMAQIFDSLIITSRI